jgi:hypothetical protein
MQYQVQYGPYKELCEKGIQKINTKDITKESIDAHFYSLLNILRDGIEKREVQNMKINVVFADRVDINLSIFDYIINLMMWHLNCGVGEKIESTHLFFPENITKGEIKKYIDNVFIDRYRKSIQFIDLNQIIDNCLGKFRELRPFQLYLANTLNLEDTIELMNKNKEFNELVHFSADNIPLEDIKDEAMKATRRQIEIIKKSNHCLKDSFATHEGISDKQYNEVATIVGTKPDGNGGVYNHPIRHSFMNGGVQTPEEITIESSVGRVAQILQKTNVGESGAFSRNLELNNQETTLNPDPNYICDTKHFQKVTIENDTILKMFDLRYYRENPNGVDKLLESKRDRKLIGKTLYFRSPMTCASAARGQGICYKCYGDLAYANQEINIGQIAAENLSAKFTQILLSAKHLLESLIVKMEWVEGFFDVFDLEYNIISVKENFMYKGYKLVIDDEIKHEEDIDEVAFNDYVNSFTVVFPDGHTLNCHTSEADNIYFTSEFLDFIGQKKNKAVNFIDRDGDGDDIIEIDMSALESIPLFVMDIKNNELSKTMESIKKLIDNKTEISKYDHNTILEKFISTCISGNIVMNSVHFEVLLMNQMRDGEDELELPDWTLTNPSYQILRLSRSLSNNRSIAIRLQTNNTQQVLRNPQNERLHQPAMVDLFYMEQPQEYLSDEIISDDYKPKSDKEDNAEEPIELINSPGTSVGRPVHKRKVSYKKVKDGRVEL